LEKELRVDAPASFPVLQVRKAWRANESSWMEECRTIGRQLGAMWGGKLGKEIEVACHKLHLEMFTRMAEDPILRGPKKKE
jgi:hypothetical protein